MIYLFEVNFGEKMEWLSPFTTVAIFLILADWIINDSYHRFLFKKNKQLEKPYFKSKYHKIYHKIINIITIIGATLIIIKWIFF